jgi:hypothetical protein
MQSGGLRRLSAAERAALAEWGYLCERGFTMADKRRLRFACWLVASGRLTEWPARQPEPAPSARLKQVPATW